MESMKKNSIDKIGWLFKAYKTEEDYKKDNYFFEAIFFDHTQLKIFSTDLSFKFKHIYSNLVSNYWKIEVNYEEI